MRIEPVGPARGALSRAFHEVPRRIYRRDPHWTPPLGAEERHRFDRRRNPALRKLEVGRWVALAGSEPVARIAAFVPPTPEDTGWIGCFESPDDPAVAGPLFAAAESWLRSRGRTRSVGPVQINPRDHIGMLTSGFDRPATLSTPYNPPWYPGLFAARGYRPLVGLGSFAWTPELARRNDGFVTRSPEYGARSRIVLRPLNARRLEAEVRAIATLVNTAFAETWGWLPVSETEAAREARDLARILDPNLIWFAERGGQPVAVSITVPDPNWLARQIGGRLWPTGWLTALRLRRRIPWARFMVLAVLPGWRAGGTALRLMLATDQALRAGGYQYAELAQVFDDNRAMRRILERIGAPEVKRFAVYHRQLPTED